MRGCNYPDRGGPCAATKPVLLQCRVVTVGGKQQTIPHATSCHHPNQ